MRSTLLLVMVTAVTLPGCREESTNEELASKAVPEAPTTPATVESEQSEIGDPIETESPATGTSADGAAESGQTGGQLRGRMGRGRGFRPDMSTIHTMFAHRDTIRRTVKKTATGAEATTESDDEDVVALLQEHVPAMEARVHNNSPLPPMTVHPSVQSLIKHKADYVLSCEDTANGVKATYTAKEPFVILLVQEHAQLVSRFLQNGMSEIHRPYKFPTASSD
ncbi:MAG: hypothetical protein AB8G99_01330, partial [Planctomycetaceae bacterium]